MDINKLTYELIKDLLPDSPSSLVEVGEGTANSYPYVKTHDNVEAEYDWGTEESKYGQMFGTTVYEFEDAAGNPYNVVLEYEGDTVEVAFTTAEAYEPTNAHNLFPVMATVVKIIKQDLSEYPKQEVSIIKYTPSATKTKGPGARGGEQRDRLYRAYLQKYLPKARIQQTGRDVYVYLEESYKGKKTDNGAPGTFKAKITKTYGGNVTLEKAKKFKERKNATPLDKKQANWFINFHSKNEALEKESGTQEEGLYTTDYTFEPPVQKQLEPLMVELTQYMYEQGLNIDPAPEIEFVEDEENAKNPLGRTAYYDPNSKLIVLYTTGRHPKDILRSFAHEMIHHVQNLEGRLENMTGTTNINEDEYLADIEREAYHNGNMLFRAWENDREGNNSLRNIKGFTPGSYEEEPSNNT